MPRRRSSTPHLSPNVLVTPGDVVDEDPGLAGMARTAAASPPAAAWVFMRDGRPQVRVGGQGGCGLAHRPLDRDDVATGGDQPAGEVVAELVLLSCCPVAVAVEGQRHSALYQLDESGSQSSPSNFAFAAANSSSDRMPSLCRPASSRTRSARVGPAAA